MYRDKTYGTLMYRDVSSLYQQDLAQNANTYKRSSKDKGGETGCGGSEKSQCKSFPSPISLLKENDWQERVRKLAQAHDVSAKTIHATLHNDLHQRSRPGG
jgi:hypothetical protein